MSALGQVLSIKLRSNLLEDPGDGSWVYKESAAQHQTAQAAAKVAKAAATVKDVEVGTKSRKESSSNGKGEASAAVAAATAVATDAAAPAAVAVQASKALPAQREEIDYIDKLNRLLPPDIRITAWTPVVPEFNARFSAKRRTYKYYFVVDNLDVAAMQAAAQMFVGEHDFRNFCKMDISGGVTNFTRKILSVDISASVSEKGLSSSTEAAGDSRFQVGVATIVGQAFLWHQIRCVMAVLFMVGRHEEDPEVVSKLLDIAAHPKKPNYEMASDLPLVLYDCEFNGITWIRKPGTHARLCQHMHTAWKEYAIKAALVEGMMKTFDEALVHSGLSEKGVEHRMDASEEEEPWSAIHQHFPLSKRSHQPMFSRQTSNTLEEKLAVYAKKVEAKEALAASAAAAADGTTAAGDAKGGGASSAAPC